MMTPALFRINNIQKQTMLRQHRKYFSFILNLFSGILTPIFAILLNLFHSIMKLNLRKQESNAKKFLQASFFCHDKLSRLTKPSLVVLAIVYFLFMCCSFTQPSPSSFSWTLSLFLFMLFFQLDPLPLPFLFIWCIDSFTLIRLAVSDINHRCPLAHAIDFQLKIP